MKKILSMVIRIGLLLTMVVIGFLAVFPEWWDLRDLQRLDKAEQVQINARAQRSADLKAQRDKEKMAVFSAQQFPDENFLRCVLAQNKNRAEQIVNLDCSNQGIVDVQGLSKLTGLTRLNLSGNLLVNLNVQANTKLSELIAKDNALIQVQLPSDYLRKVDLAGNELLEFDLSHSPRLDSLDLSQNRLQSLRISSSALKYLWADNNNLNSVFLDDLSRFEALSLRHNQIETLNLNALLNLRYVDLSENPLQQLEVGRSVRQSIRALLISDTSLSVHDIQQLGKHVQNLSTASIPKSLFPDPAFRRCVQAHSTDAYASVNKIDCNRNDIGLLSKRAAIQSVEGIENLFALTDINLGFQEIEFINVSNLLKLENLIISSNQLTQLDLRTNSQLQTVVAANNKISEVKLQSNRQLETLYMSSNKLRSLDVAEIPNIKAVQLMDNEIRSLDFSKATQLKRLMVDNNQLTNLDLSGVRYPTQISVKNNPLNAQTIRQLREQFWSAYPEVPDDKVFLKKPSLPVFSLLASDFPDPLFKKCVEDTIRRKKLNELNEIKRLDCSYQDIENLQGLELIVGLEYLILQGIDAVEVPLSNHPKLKNILITELPLTALDLSQLPALKSVDVSRNRSLEVLELPKKHSIEHLAAEFNALRRLHISDGKQLKRINLKSNHLTELSFGDLTQVVTIDVTNNSLQNIDLSTLPQLKKLMIVRNVLTQIDVSHNTELQELYVAINQIESLNLDHNPEIESLAVFNNPLKVLNLNDLKKITDLAVDQAQFDAMVARGEHLQFENNPRAKALGSIIMLSKQRP